ncbi:hypothetical protein [Bacillus sp. REN10]|uniref:hypothetical protein n=1 Tax=Bacillus sp. REN10 TaxID=2782541 RepID=UPI00193B20A5|nr:hypothetical protein [Bacillus sp. REN10]
MKKVAMNLLILCLYGFPFVYFSMYKDFADGSMIGYVLMILVTSILAFIGQYSHHTMAVFIGNLVSAVVSYYFITQMAGNDRWGGYFKPLAPVHLLVLVSVLNIIPQRMAMNLAKKYKRG